MFESAGVELQVGEVGVDFGEGAEPLGGEGGFVALGTGTFGVGGTLGQLVGEVESEHPRGTACVDLPRFSVHRLNLTLTAIL